MHLQEAMLQDAQSIKMEVMITGVANAAKEHAKISPVAPRHSELLKNLICMVNTISSLFRYANNMANGRCQILDNEGNIMAEFDGEIEETSCKFLVRKGMKLYCIVEDNNSGKYVLEEYKGGSLI